MLLRQELFERPVRHAALHLFRPPADAQARDNAHTIPWPLAKGRRVRIRSEIIALGRAESPHTQQLVQVVGNHRRQSMDTSVCPVGQKYESDCTFHFSSFSRGLVWH